MAHDTPGKETYLIRALALARSLNRLSRYPLVLLANATRWSDGTSVATSFEALGVRVLPLHPIASGYTSSTHVWAVSDWRLQAWTLTQFEKLVWIDTDAVVYRSLDWLFARPGMWAMRDDTSCADHGSEFSLGLLVLYPNKTDYKSLLELAGKFDTADSGHKSQSLLSTYFIDVHGKPLNLLSSVEASHGRCLGQASSPYINPDGSTVQGYWSTPAFVHRSGGWDSVGYDNVCFSPELSKQKYYVGVSILNACQFNPLAAYWRTSLCEAVMIAGIRDLTSIGDFCSDSCYYLGEGAACGGRLNATLAYPEYYAKTKGMPEPEVSGRLGQP
eukprot:CAMPEP_0177348668 /NCGR_PEP_ID=MMETSP0368-20130122/30388_1 /TAXON_ID=447022 ORGANISM="Scrippsiella hangoei-like, Strain SHHI-4" /NCGR_SAMPLE_ID=MMETSP0368 /ASSEMBLY_ACC=CAM_ASM_000363 /LENGTH=329 /DNA_ID=CAMNT_0018810495 /DNA_START=13 /DNA_END=1002 /DNA_ORIENTATION=-